MEGWQGHNPLKDSSRQSLSRKHSAAQPNLTFNHKKRRALTIPPDPELHDTPAYKKFLEVRRERIAHRLNAFIAD